MKTHRSPLVAGASRHLRSLLLVVAFVLTTAGLATLALADDSGDAAKKPSSGTRIYTNADLAKYAQETGTSTSSKEYVPPQPVTTHDSKEGWDFVFAMIDREHERAARSQEAADAAAAAYEASKYEPEPTYYAPYYGYGYAFNNGCFNGDCRHGCNGSGPFTHRSNCTPQPTNTFRPLDERGIRTPQDLWREARRNAAIQRSQIVAPSQGFALVPSRTPTATPHR